MIIKTFNHTGYFNQMSFHLTKKFIAPEMSHQLPATIHHFVSTNNFGETSESDLSLMAGRFLTGALEPGTLYVCVCHISSMGDHTFNYGLKLNHTFNYSLPSVV